MSRNTQLTKLEACYNNLEELDVTHNTQLTFLDASQNFLWELDTTHNTQLTSLSWHDEDENVGQQATEVWDWLMTHNL